MNTVSVTLHVFFENPFWVGIYECNEHGRMRTSRMIYGKEPSDQEVYASLPQLSLRTLSPPVTTKIKAQRKNPKRVQREVHKQLHSTYTGTKSQQALQLLREEQKKERFRKSKEIQKEEKIRKFEQKQQKKKEKHKGH